MPPSSNYQHLSKSGQHTEMKLPRSVDGGTLPAIYPKGLTDLAADGITDAENNPRAALLHTTEDSALFSIGGNPVNPFCPIPANVMLLVNVPANEKIKASAAMRVIWL